MNRPPLSSSPIGSLRKRRSKNNVVFIAAGALVFIGLAVLIYWLFQPGKPLSNLIATETPTPTITPSPTNTNTITPSPTETSTPTITFTPTFSAPFTYTVQDGDYLQLIVEKFALGDNAIPLILILNEPYIDTNGNPGGIDPTTQIVIPGQVILLPYPGMPLPTATPLPPDLRPGTLIDYVVQSGDSLAGIANLFNSTIDAISKQNNITNPNELFVGQLLQIPVNLVTPTATRPPTSTPITPGPGTVLPTATFTPINVPTNPSGTP
ncbi:MAG: LysM peptidoglycan-binding domain-containing protein [Anaerolineales bacterium]|nr:LysM peptidoglycan-binding domain-containing protein [Anaerolineales bacterium]